MSIRPKTGMMVEAAKSLPSTGQTAWTFYLLCGVEYNNQLASNESDGTLTFCLDIDGLLYVEYMLG